MIKLKELLLKETEDADVDAAFYGSKKIPVDRPPDIHKKEPLKKLKMKKDDDETDHFKISPLQEALDTAAISREDRQNITFMSGLKLGVQDKAANRKSDLQGYPEDFIRGYKVVKIPGVWDRFNDRLTNWAAALGSSRLR